MKKEQQIIESIQSFIEEGDIEIGAQLPSERKFAEMFLTSRNTVRGAIRKLEARGLVEIRRGSGCYLLSKQDAFAAWKRIGAVESPHSLHSLFEARYLLEPSIGSLSAEKRDANDLESLERCLVQLGRSFMGNIRQSVVEGDTQFRKIIAKSTGNAALISLMDQFTASNTLVFSTLEQSNEETRDRIFADYVEMINAIKDRNRTSIAVTICRNVKNQYSILRQYSVMVLPRLDAASIRPQGQF